MTQLLNSFLGALAHPWEAYQTEFCDKSLSEVTAAGWPKIIKERPRDRDRESLGDLVRLMRNAIAHGNLEFLPGHGGEIRALRMWNMDRGRRTWGALVTVANMRSFLTCFVDLAEQLGAKRGDSTLRTA